MSIILKGIDMPKEEEAFGSKWRVVIHLAIGSNGMVLEQDSYGNWLRSNIEVIQIPKGHGNIKDAGKLEDELDSRCGQLSAEIVRNAPTILDEEKE